MFGSRLQVDSDRMKESRKIEAEKMQAKKINKQQKRDQAKAASSFRGAEAAGAVDMDALAAQDMVDGRGKNYVFYKSSK